MYIDHYDCYFSISTKMINFTPNFYDIFSFDFVTKILLTLYAEQLLYNNGRRSRKPILALQQIRLSKAVSR